MKVHDRARELASYTAKICSNEKVFTPAVNAELVKRIKNYAYDIHEKAWAANKLRADTSHVERELRYTAQVEAIELCERLLSAINVAKSVFHLRSKRIKYWSEKVREVETLLQKWKESDVSRYGKPQR